jgi:16S rRNA (adenine1518-N6/adenine1519-N6)-dimethyltransferase
MSRERIITSQLETEGINPSERLGQHFLTDERIINELAAYVIEGSKVIEVGSGIGHVTEVLAQRAGSVIGIEIDKRFQPILEDIQERNPKIRFIFGDALRVRLDSLIGKGEETQVVANLPFHITEPFMHKLIDLPITNAILMLGNNVAREFQESEASLSFGKLSLLVQTFFDYRVLSQVPKTAFYPQPRTNAVIIEFNPKDRREIESNPADYLFAYLFRRARKFGLVINDIKQALVEMSQKSVKIDLSKRESHRRDRSNVKRELRQMLVEYNNSRDASIFRNQYIGGTIISQSQAIEVINKMGIPKTVLNKPFFKLNNQDIRNLVAAIRRFYMR